jgi:hypothetical protein
MVLDSLEGDGISDVLLHWLHAKDELGYGPSLWLPDTVVYKFGQPVHWYFTSAADGKIKKKNKQNLVNVRIEETFNKRNIGCDIVAYYISEVTDESGGGATTNIEYFDRRGLHDFLYNRWKEHNGVLQRFVEPKGIRNVVIRAIWSPKVCLLERRVNAKQLHDHRYGLYERAVTYEGPEHFSAAAPLRGSTLPSQIQRICENLVTHINEVSFQKHRIARMVINFKVDSRDRIWLLWSSSIRLTSEHKQAPISIGNAAETKQAVSIDSIVQLPPYVKLVDKASHSEAEPESLACVCCVSCAKVATSDQFHPVQYKTIITHFERLLSLLQVDTETGLLKWPPAPEVIAAAGGVGFGNLLSHQERNKQEPRDINVTLPPIIRKVHPKLTPAMYRKYRRDPLFMYKTVAVCEDCFLVYAELANSPLTLMTTQREIVSSSLGMGLSSRAPPWENEPLGRLHHEHSHEAPIKPNRNTWMLTEAPSMPAPIYSSPNVASDASPNTQPDKSGLQLSVDEIVRRRGV